MHIARKQLCLQCHFSTSTISLAFVPSFFNKSSCCKITLLFWQRHSFDLKGKDLFPSLYSKNYLFSSLSGQQIQGVA